MGQVHSRQGGTMKQRVRQLVHIMLTICSQRQLYFTTGKNNEGGMEKETVQERETF